MHRIPTRELAVAFALKFVKGATPELVDEWYADMEAGCWCDERGAAIQNWAVVLRKWIRFSPFFAALRDPNRLPSARSRGPNDADLREAESRRRQADELAARLLRGGAS